MEFITTACNRHAQALDWNTVHNLIAYAAHHTVAIYAPVGERKGMVLGGEQKDKVCWIQS